MKEAETPPKLGEQDEFREGRRVVAWMPEALYREMRRAADEQYLLMSEYLRNALRKYLDLTDCEECKMSGVPGDAFYCPYCGVEFDLEEEDEEEEEEDVKDRDEED